MAALEPGIQGNRRRAERPLDRRVKPGDDVMSERKKNSAAEKEKSAAENIRLGGRTNVSSVQGSGKDGYLP
jgi:hypothetical protein